MGLDTTHDCWSGAYSSFNRWRTKLAEVAGFGALREYEGFTDNGKPWPKDDPLTILLHHSDCEGSIKWEDCSALADALEGLMPALNRDAASDGYGGVFDTHAQKAQKFIDGLRKAHELKEDVEFH